MLDLFSRLFSKPIKETSSASEESTKGEEQRPDRLRRIATYLASHATEQADSIRHAIVKADEIRKKVAQNDAQVSLGLTVNEKVRLSSQERLRVLDRLQKAMDAIKHSNHLLAELQASFQAIHAKTRKINDIVAKTQLLSFNASIEAARAGQFGKGFSVVAEEVGRLAQSSGQAAREIELLVSDSEVKSTSIVEVMMGQVNEGLNVTRDVRASFTDLADAIEKIAESLASISQVSREQTLCIDRTTGAIERIHLAAIKSKQSIDDLVRLSQGTQVPTFASPTPDLNRLVVSLTSSDTVGASRKKTSTQGLNADDPSFKKQD